MAFGEEARMLAEMDQRESANHDVTMALNRIAVALEKAQSLDMQADAKLVAQLDEYQNTHQEVEIVCNWQGGYYHGHGVSRGWITEVDMGIVRIRLKEGGTHILRVSEIKQVILHKKEVGWESA